MMVVEWEMPKRERAFVGMRFRGELRCWGAER